MNREIRTAARSLLNGILIACTGFWFAGAALAAEESGANAGSSLEEVIVTATRRALAQTLARGGL